MEKEKIDNLEEKKETSEEKKEKVEEKRVEKKEKVGERKETSEEKPIKIVKETIHSSNTNQNPQGKQVLTEKIRENPWIASTLVLGILAIIFIASNFSGDITGKTIAGEVISETEIGNSILELAKAQVKDAELVGIEQKSGLYEVTLLMEGNEIPVYVTLDGENLIGGLTPLAALKQQNQNPSQTQDDSQQPSSIVKSNKPMVELFVMTHCPYGTQAEKGFIPAILELDDSINAEIKFVHYFLHDPEETETPRQVCIREEQPDKFLKYLKCFLKDGDSDRCIKEAEVNKIEMEKCISSGKSDEYYEIDSLLSKNYGVKGSPTLVINGQITQSGRSAAAYLDTICNSFNNAPEECSSLELDSETPSTGFGYDTTTAISQAQCG